MTIRQEIQAYINDISESKLLLLKPLLASLADEIVRIEYDLTNEEKNLIAKGMEEYKNNPENFVSLDSIV